MAVFVAGILSLLCCPEKVMVEECNRAHYFGRSTVDNPSEGRIGVLFLRFLDCIYYHFVI